MIADPEPSRLDSQLWTLKSQPQTINTLMPKQKPIRLGLLRCDIHAYFFAPFMVRADPVKLQENCTYVHGQLADKFSADKLAANKIPGFKLTHVWDPDVGEADKFAETFTDGPIVCRRPEQMVGEIDAAFVANCSFDGSDHLAIVRPLLKAGIPTFIDKPMADSYKNAKSIVDLAVKYDAPLFAASILHHADEVHNFRRRLRDFHRVHNGLIEGSHGWETKGGLEGITHGVALALTVFGNDVDWVECMGALPREIILLHYPDGRQVLVWNMNHAVYQNGFFVRAWGEHATRLSNAESGECLESLRIGQPEYPMTAQKIAKMFRQMVRAGEPPVPYEQLLLWCRVCDAARRAQESGKRVRL